jgi:hypothetical protein
MSITRDDAHIARQVAQQSCRNVWRRPLDVPISTEDFKAIRPRVTGSSAVALETTIRVWETLDQITGEDAHQIEDIGYHEEKA